MTGQARSLAGIPGLARVRLSAWLSRMAFGALVLLSAALAFEMRSPVARIGALQLTGVEMLVGLALLLWLADRALATRWPQIPVGVALPLAVWLVVLVLSAILAPSHRAEAVLFLARVLAGIMVGWAAYGQADTFPRQRAVAAALVVCGAGVALLGLAEGFGGARVLAWLGQFKESQTRIGDVIRISSTLSYATIAAMILELALPIALALALAVQSRWRRGLIAAGIALILVTLVLTLSRAGVIALLAALALMAFYGFRWQHRVLMAGSIAAGGILIALVLLVLIWNPVTALRFSTESEQQWYRAAYHVEGDLAARPNEVLTIPVRLVNAGARAWDSSGENTFALSYHLYTEAGEPVTYDGPRTPLPASVQTGETMVIQAAVVAPSEQGAYQIEWDLLQENVTWFSWKGTPTSLTRLAVAGEPLDVQFSPPMTQPPTDIRVIAPTPERSVLWQAALQMALRRPLLGVGPDNFRWLYGSYVGLARWNTAIHSNSLYLEWLADTGIVGLAAFLWFSWRLFRDARPGSIAAPEFQHLLALGLFASLAAWYVHGLVDYFYEFTPTYVAFWLIAGLALRVRGGGDAYRH